MTLPQADILSASASSDRGVLLSERTQLLAIKAIQIAELRDAWDDMTDNEWDEIDAAIAQAHTEILTIQGSSSMATYQSIERATTQAIPANTLTKIIFPNVTGLGTDLYVTETGIAVITARVAVVSGSAGLQYARLLHEGAEVARDDNRATAVAQYFELTEVREVDAGDEIALEVYALNGTTAQTTPFTPQIKLVIL